VRINGAIDRVTRRVCDSLTVSATDSDEKTIRKRRLIKGPEEFREMRVDRAKPK
jgi:hypothetical protein